MASSATTTSRRAILGALAVAPAAALPVAHSGDVSQWERRLQDYLLLKALKDADAAFGRFHSANEVHDLAKIRRGERPGDTSEAAKAAWEVLEGEEAIHQKQFTEPLWAAGRLLAMTPAPTVEALVAKVQIITDEEIWNDAALPGEAMDYILADARRLAAGRA